MIPIFRTAHMENAANVLLTNFRTVLIRANYDNRIRIRFRADKVINGMVYFNKVESQKKKWHEKGGALVTWKSTYQEGEHDAIVVVECPKSMEVLHRTIARTTKIAVIYVPPTWRPHLETINWRYRDRPLRKARIAHERFSILCDFVDRLPTFSRHRLRNLLPSLGGRSRSSSAPARSAAAARSPDTTG